MIHLPATGPSEAKSKFFAECSAAFEFLSLYHRLSAKDQEELLADVKARYAMLQHEKMGVKR